MGGMGVLTAELQCPLRDAEASADVAGFGVRPAEVGQEPPVIPVVPRMSLADGQLRLVVVCPTREGVEAIRPEQQGEHQGVPGKRLYVLLCEMSAAGGPPSIAAAITPTVA